MKETVEDKKTYFFQVQEKLLELKDKVAAKYIDKIKKVDFTGPANISCTGGNEEKLFGQTPQEFTAEEKLLLSIDIPAFKNIDRMIFIHKKNWNQQKVGNWRDYIPIDQSTSCFSSNALL